MRGKLDKQPIITKQKPIRASRNRIKADRKLGPNFPKTLRAMDEMDVGEADPVFFRRLSDWHRPSRPDPHRNPPDRASMTSAAVGSV